MQRMNERESNDCNDRVTYFIAGGKKGAHT